MSACRFLPLPLDSPLDEPQLCKVAVWYATRHKITSISSFFSAVAKSYVNNGWGELPRGHLYKAVRAGLRNLFGLHDELMSRRALSAAQLMLFARGLQWRTVDESSVICAMCVAFAGCLRVSEYTDGALCWRDISFSDVGIRLVVRFSKKSLRPVSLWLPCRDDELCPWRALVRHRVLCGAVPPDEPVFVRRGKPLSSDDFVRCVRACVVSFLRVDARLYAGHSFRSGGTNELLRLGVAESAVLQHGRWTSAAAMRRYVRLDEGGVPLLPAILAGSKLH